jgi:hypothetical protein
MNSIYWASFKAWPLTAGGAFFLVYLIFNFYITEWFVDLLSFF